MDPDATPDTSRRHINMPFASAPAWPPMPEMSSYGQRTPSKLAYAWPPGSELKWDIDLSAAGTAEVPTMDAGASAANFGSASHDAHDAHGGVDPAEAQRILALASTAMAPKGRQTAGEYAAAHGIEGLLNSGLNAVAATMPAAPLSAIAKMMPASGLPTPTLPASADEAGMGALRHAWIALHSWEEGK